jgi:hypothetical protein
MDCPADGVVCCEPFSGVKFPDHQGKYREFCRFEAILSWPEPKSPRVRCAFLRNSLKIVTGNFDRGSGKGNSLIRFRAGISPAEKADLDSSSERTAHRRSNGRPIRNLDSLL